MNYLSALSLLVSFLSLAEGLYVLLTSPSNPLNRRYFYMTLCIALWLFGASFAYSGKDREVVIFWFRICSFGFIFLHACTLHFIITLTRPLFSVTQGRMFYLLYLPSLLFQYQSLTGTIVFREFVKEGAYWTAEPDFNSPVFLLLVVNYLVYYLLSAILLVLYAKRVASKKEKRKAWLLFIAILSTILFYNLEPFLVPYFTAYRPLVVSPLFSIVWISIIAYAIIRYNFLSYRPSIITREILDSIDEAVLVFDSELRLVYANKFIRRLREKLPSRHEALPSSVYGWFPESASLKSALTELLSKSTKSFSCVLSLYAMPRKLFQARFSLIRDTDGSPSGLVFIGKETVTGSTFFAEKGITRKEEQVLEHLIQGDPLKTIAETLHMGLRTVKTHCAHIYQKLGVKNRFQLLELLHNSNLMPDRVSDRKLFPLIERQPPSGHQ